MRRQRVWQVAHTESDLERVTSFALDESTGEVVLGTHGGLVSIMSTRTDLTNVISNTPQTTVTWFNSRVSSISLSRCGEEKTIVCCSMGNERHSGAVHLARFVNSENLDGGPSLYMAMRPSTKQALLCSTTSRYQPDVCAIGGEDVIIFTRSLNENRYLKTDTCCMSLEFLGPHTLVSGGRNGVMKYICHL